jgi:hypothetical protein
MSDIGRRVQQLNGQTLKTRAQGREFEIIGVSHDRIEFVPKRGNGTRRWISRQWIEQVADLRLDESELRPSRLAAEFPNDQNLSYMAAIVHAATGRTSKGE